MTFERIIPGAEDEARTIIMNSNAIYRLQEAINGLVEDYNQSLEQLEETGRYGPSTNN